MIAGRKVLEDSDTFYDEFTKASMIVTKTTKDKQHMLLSAVYPSKTHTQNMNFHNKNLLQSNKGLVSNKQDDASEFLSYIVTHQDGKQEIITYKNYNHREIHVLIVDDNVFNQIILEKYL